MTQKSVKYTFFCGAFKILLNKIIFMTCNDLKPATAFRIFDLRVRMGKFQVIRLCLNFLNTKRSVTSYGGQFIASG